MASRTHLYDITNLAQVETIKFFDGTNEALTSADRHIVYDNSDNISAFIATNALGGGTYPDDVRFEELSAPSFEVSGATNIRLTFQDSVSGGTVSNSDTVTVDYLDAAGNVLGSTTLYTIQTGNTWGGRMGDLSSTEDFILLTNDPDHQPDGNDNVYIFGPGITQSGEVFVADESWTTGSFVLPDGYVDGTAGNDVIDASYTGDPDGDMVDANDAVQDGHSGDEDVIRAGDGNDSVLAGDGADTLFGDDGDDTLEGGAGADSIDGGAGTDWASYESSDAAVTVSLDIGQSNNQTGGIAADGGHATGDTLTGIENLQGSDFDDVLEGDGANNEILGGDGNDSLYGVLGNDLVQGGSGNDFADGGVGHDTVQGGIGDDTVDGGNGNDFVEGGDGNDHVIGGRGNDLLSGNDGNDSLEGRREDDTVLGHAGDDTVSGGEGEDFLSGGAGDDVFIYQPTGFGNDTIDDFGDGNSGSIDDGDQTNNDFVDLSLIYTQANYDAAVLAGNIDPNVIKTPLQWMRADQADDGILNDSNAFGAGDSLTIMNSGAAVDASDLTFDNTAVLCFVRGSRIATEQGLVAVEQLKVGDRVITRDNGFQTIRWIGSTTRPASGKAAPVLIREGALGNERDLLVSPNHRMLLKTPGVELVSGEYEVLAPAKFLVDNSGICHVIGGLVEYYHLLFDRHEIINAEGCWSESFHPGHVGWSTLCENTRDEILALFPDLKTDGQFNSGTTARLVLDRKQMIAARAVA